MQEPYLPLKPSHAQDTSCSYTSVMSSGAMWKVEISLQVHHQKYPAFEHTFLAILYNKQAALKLKMTSLLFLEISCCCLENFEYATFRRYVGINCFLKRCYILGTCMLWASGSWAQCIYRKGKGQEGVVLMNRELAVGVSEKVTSSL